mgnify:CR=1 FL=1
MSKTVYILSAVRTPMGSFMGAFSGVSATQLGATAIQGALEKAQLDPALIDEVFMGNVLQAGVGQAPALPAHLADLFEREERCTVLANDLKTVQSFVAQHGNRGKPL